MLLNNKIPGKGTDSKVSIKSVTQTSSDHEALILDQQTPEF